MVSTTAAWYICWAGLLTQVASTTAPSTGGGIDYLPRWPALQLQVQVVDRLHTQVVSPAASGGGLDYFLGPPPTALDRSGGLDYLSRWSALQLLLQVLDWTTYPGGQHYSS